MGFVPVSKQKGGKTTMKQRDAPDVPMDEEETNRLAKFEIMFDDLSFKAQARLCETFDTHPVMERWETQPLATISRLVD
jgi:hypothetical protein